MLDSDEQLSLLRLARRALEARVLRLPELAIGAGEEIAAVGGAFVSLHRLGALRGCLGRMEPSPLAQAVADLARAVADCDPRFHAVRPDELADIHIEISILTPERPILSPAEVEVGRHGLIVERESRRGLLLPQVACEQGWDAVTFVEHTCVKAGLPRHAWRNGAQMYVFEAFVFGERRA